MSENLTALYTLIRREVMRILRIWPQTLVPPAITMTLYFLIFGGLIGSRVGDMGGFDYMAFIVPGLVMMSVIQNSYGNISSSFFGAKFGRHIEELMVSPMPNWVILAGYVAGAVLRGLLVGAIVLGIAMFFTPVRIPHPLVTLSSVLLGAVIFSLAGFVNAVYAKKFDDIAIIPTFVLTPLTYLGGGVLLRHPAASLGRNRHPLQPRVLHGQRLSLRFTRAKRCTSLAGVCTDGRVRAAPGRLCAVVAQARHGHAQLGLSSQSGEFLLIKSKKIHLFGMMNIKSCSI